MKTRIPILVAGAGLLLVGVLAVVDFQVIASLFGFFSPDGVINPDTLLELRIVLASFGVIGLYLLFRRQVHRLLAGWDRRLTRLPQTTFLIRFLVIGLLLRLAVVMLMDIPMYIDYQGYDQLAWDWVQHGGYYNGDLPTGYYPVGYPFFLSRLYLVFGHAPLAGVLANVFLSLAISLLSYLIARRAFDERIARWALVIMLFFPSQILFVNLLASEMVFTPLFLLSLWLLLVAGGQKGRRLWLMILSGVALGLATLTRSLTQAYWILLFPVWFHQGGTLSKTARNALLFLVGFGVVVTPWLVRNYHVVGRAALSTNGGINFMIGNNPSSGMGWIAVDTVEFNTHDPRRETYIDSVGWRRGWEYIRSNPAAFFKRGLKKVTYFFAGDIIGIHYEYKQAAEAGRLNWSVLIALIAQCYYLPVLLFGFLGMVVYFRRRELRSPGGYIMWVTVLFWVAVHFVFFGHARFHFPIMPMIAGFAALYIVAASEKSHHAATAS